METGKSTTLARLLSLRSSPNFLPRAGRRARGFTLLEILLVLAIIALMATVLIGGAVNLLSEKPVAPDDVFWKVVQESRKAALTSGREMRLTFDDKDKKFVLASNEDADGPSREFPIPNAGEIQVGFLSTQKGASAILLGGVAVETDAVQKVIFYPDGTCSPFRLQIQKNAAVHTLDIDSWTCAPMLKAGDTNLP